ncbi:acyltransferase [Longimycelium tulufanense]|uniref:Acyltransferase n=1 Tax=Longimycelium tulufanense TaxID=907463 RepID=A0A8J3C919_9PSEU|nr:acyltransferase [Longimycelium tulufanense]GGM57598.1 acyltransferase [Longimycelium tulufanense]
MMAGATGRERSYVPGVPLLRMIGAVAVVYTHLAYWYQARGYEWSLAMVLNTSIVESLHLIDHFEAFGLSLFLVISGLVITQAASKEAPGQFGTRRAVRLLPALWVALLLALLLVNTGLLNPGSGRGPASFGDLLGNMTLIEFFLSPHVILIGPTWTLVVQISFYTFVALMIPVLRRWPWIVPAVGATLSSVVLSLVWDLEGSTHLWIGVIAAYMPMLFIGQVIMLAWTGRVPGWAAALLGSIHFLLFVRADMIGRYVAIGDARPRTLFIAVLLVLVLLNASGRIARHRATSIFAARTYCLYLLHQMALYPVLDWAFPTLGEIPALLLAFATTAVVTEAMYRFIEAPVSRHYRRWEKNRRKPATPRPTAAPVPS